MMSEGHPGEPSRAESLRARLADAREGFRVRKIWDGLACTAGTGVAITGVATDHVHVAIGGVLALVGGVGDFQMQAIGVSELQCRAEAQTTLENLEALMPEVQTPPYGFAHRWAEWDHDMRKACESFSEGEESETFRKLDSAVSFFKASGKLMLERRRIMDALDDEDAQKVRLYMMVADAVLSPKPRDSDTLERYGELLDKYFPLVETDEVAKPHSWEEALEDMSKVRTLARLLPEAHLGIPWRKE